MRTVNRDLLLRKIVHSRELTALEKRYLEGLMNRAQNGQWLEDEYGFSRCSICGYEWGDPEYNEPYCPKCGAKMDGGEQDA